jgi:hypothetical protein
VIIFVGFSFLFGFLFFFLRFFLGGGWFGFLPFDVFVWLPRKMYKYFWIDRYWGFCFLLNYGLCLMKLEQKNYLRLMKQMGRARLHPLSSVV